MSMTIQEPGPSTQTAVKKGKRKSAPLGKQLASNEKEIRDKAVASLASYLCAGADLEDLSVGENDWDSAVKLDDRFADLELAKLWKGIFYCYWMSDKPLVQQKLSDDLAQLLLAVRPKKAIGRVARTRSALAFLDGFWQTMGREWSNIDIHRLDKYYMLIRRFQAAAFQLLAREEWDENAIKAYNEILLKQGGPLYVQSNKTPTGITYHLYDIFNGELEKCLEQTPPEKALPLATLLQPYIISMSLSPVKPTFLKVSEELFKPLLQSNSPAPAPTKSKKRKVEVVETEDEYPSISSAMQLETREQRLNAILDAIWEVASRPETDDANRGRMYKLVRQFRED